MKAIGQHFTVTAVKCWYSYDCFCRAEEQAAEAEQTLDIARAMPDGELTALNLARLDHLLRLVERNIKSIAALSRRGVTLETPKLGAMQ